MISGFVSICCIQEEDNNGGQDENDEEDDGFFVPHGYLSEDEGGKEDFQRMVSAVIVTQTNIIGKIK